jgi:predicted NAD/FAD-binding protein
VTGPVRNIAVVGAGVSGLSAAWLLSKRHRVTLYEAEGRLGGHANTVEAAGVAVDTGFIVFNEPNYPNLTALFRHLGVETHASDMSFGVSMDGGRFEYGSTSLASLLAQKRNILRPRFWAMLRDLKRFYDSGAVDAARLQDEVVSLADYLDRGGFCSTFQEDHLLPQAAAIWSTSLRDIRQYPAAALLRFFDNHGLMRSVKDRPLWRTVVGGSRAYVEKLIADFDGRVLTGRPVKTILRDGEGVVVVDRFGRGERYDEVVIAAHADQALAMLDQPSGEEREVLGAFRYSRNHTVLHRDKALMPHRRAAWSSWNHLGRRGDDDGCVTYWMNRLQKLSTREDLFVTLNPAAPVDPAKVLRTQMYEHPLFDAPAIAAQRRLWSLQGERNTWFCGAHFGAGFHEDGLQSGLAVAEALGGVHRPWTVANPNGRICVTERGPRELAA